MSASSDTQFGFSFDPAPELEEPEEEIYDPPEIESPTQTFLLPEFEEEARERANQSSEEIPWAEYGTQVCLFFNQPQLEEFRELISKLAAKFNTKNQTDTIAEALRRCIALT